MDSALSRERDIVVERFLALPPREQLATFRELRDQLAAPYRAIKRDRVVAQRAAALEVLAAVAAHLGLPDGHAPTPTQFDAVCRELGLRSNRNRVRRAFGRWRFAKEQFLAQSGVSASGVRPPRAARYEAHEAAIRRWLATDPQDRRLSAYVAWARAYNEDLPDGALPLPLRADLIGREEERRLARLGAPSRRRDHGRRGAAADEASA